jgi:hypothetical protein
MIDGTSARLETTATNTTAAAPDINGTGVCQMTLQAATFLQVAIDPRLPVDPALHTYLSRCIPIYLVAATMINPVSFVAAVESCNLESHDMPSLSGSTLKKGGMSPVRLEASQWGHMPLATLHNSLKWLTTSAWFWSRGSVDRGDGAAKDCVCG